MILAAERFDRTRADDALVNFAGNLCNGLLHPMTYRFDPGCEEPHEGDPQRRDAKRHECEMPIECEQCRHDKDQRDAVHPNVDQRGTYKFIGLLNVVEHARYDRSAWILIEERMRKTLQMRK